MRLRMPAISAPLAGLDLPRLAFATLGLVLAGLIGLVCAEPARADLIDGFLDPTDGQVDASDYLLNKRGVLLNPIIVTEPAIGFGGGATAMYFHKNAEDEEKAKNGEVLGMPPSISFGMGLGTENGTWAAAGGHFGSWRKDRIRYLGGIGYASMNLDFYAGDQALAYSLKGVFLVQELDFRLFGTPLFLGARYSYAHFDSVFGAGSMLPPALPSDQVDNLGGFGINLLWDTRDNLLDPVDGEYVQVLPTFYGPWMGGDDWFQVVDIKGRSFHQPHERVGLNLRVDAALSFGDTPYYALPSVSLRGVSATRYQGRYAGAAEVEGRWRVWKRWSLIGFFGVGWRAGESERFDSPDEGVPAGGAGFRYLIARQLGLNMGMDFAGSEDQFAFYFQVGSAWR